MKLYTIGFTKKSAEEFFELLRKNGITRIIDIRLRPTSQLAGFAKKEDLAYFLNCLINCEYHHFKILAPSNMYGFPCELENPDILAPAKIGKEKNKEEEERRLFYVAVTRAKEEVIIYSQKSEEGKFLEEIKEYCITEELSY